MASAGGRSLDQARPLSVCREDDVPERQCCGGGKDYGDGGEEAAYHADQGSGA